jgi:hypothetical protein
MRSRYSRDADILAERRGRAGGRLGPGLADERGELDVAAVGEGIERLERQPRITLAIQYETATMHVKGMRPQFPGVTPESIH